MYDFDTLITYGFYLALLLGLGAAGIVAISIAVSLSRGKKDHLVMVTKRDFVVQNAAAGGKWTILAGTHEVERIPNPCSVNGIPWIVMRGTKIGMPEDYWRRWKGTRWAHFQVELRES